MKEQLLGKREGVMKNTGVHKPINRVLGDQKMSTRRQNRTRNSALGEEGALLPERIWLKYQNAKPHLGDQKNDDLGN